MTDEQMIRMRCVEAAVKFPNAHSEGQAIGALEMAKLYEHFILHGEVPALKNLL